MMRLKRRLPSRKSLERELAETITATVLLPGEKAPNETLSSDAFLKSLSVAGHALSPQFDPNRTEYSLNVGNAVSSVEIKAEARDQKAVVAGTGRKTLHEGANVFEIVATAEDGVSTKRYTIAITRAASGNGTPSSHYPQSITESAPTAKPTPSPAPSQETGNHEPAAVNPFTDVYQSDWFYESVLYAYEKGLFSGVGPTEFSPHATISRGSIAAVLHRCSGSPDASGLANPFSDVSENQYYANAIKWAAANGIASGVGVGAFSPDTPISRQDFAALLTRHSSFMGWTLPEEREFKGFSDYADMAGYATEAIEALVMAGVISGYPDGSFKPKATAARAEAATMMRYYFEAVKQ
jgi:hypothetical protein